MALPKQVRQQIADANRISAELQAARVADSGEPPAPVVEPPKEPENVVTTEPEVPVAAPVVPAAPEPDARYTELLQKHQTLQGIHRRLVNANGELQSQVQTLQAQVQGITAEVERLRQQPPAPPVSSITDDEVKEFGPDLISVIDRKAREVAAPLNEALAAARAQLEALTQRNAHLEQSLNGVTQQQAKSVQEQFGTRLLSLVPEFKVLNHDQNFLAWLSQVDPLDPHRRTLQDRLNEAVQLGDADTAASYFNTFKQQYAPPAAPKRTVADISAQAQPASRSTPDAAPVNTGRMWSQDSISQFYADVSKGRYSPSEKTRIEGEIFRAQKENRIAA